MFSSLKDQLGMEDGDLVDAFLEQVCGSLSFSIWCSHTLAGRQLAVTNSAINPSTTCPYNVFIKLYHTPHISIFTCVNSVTFRAG